jgi:DNA-binding response OmpR family regulator
VEGSTESVGILLVDDDNAVRGLARVILEHERWRVEEAGSLQEAIEKIKEGQFRPDVAVVDLLLPDGLGTELTEDLRQARPKSKIIYITGDPGWLRRLNVGSDSVLAKPFTPVQLVMAVRAALRSMRPVVVFVESGRVFRRLLVSALEQADVEIEMASSFEEGLLLARKREAAVLFTPSPSGDGAVTELLDLRKLLPSLEVVALDADALSGDSRWYDQRLLRSYSVQEVADAVRHALNRGRTADAPPSKGREMHQDGDSEETENQDQY